MTKPKPDITDPRTLAIESLKRLGGIEGFVSWAKSHRTLYYNLYAKLMAQPLVQNNNTINNVSIEAAGEDARRKLETAFIGLIEARKNSIGDPAVFVDGERLDPFDGRVIEHQPRSSDDSRRETADAVDASLNESSKSPQKGPLLKPGGVATNLAETDPTGGQNKISRYSIPTFPGQTSAIALDGCDDNLSTTQKFLNWHGHGRPP
jgi:hypothetical protein